MRLLNIRNREAGNAYLSEFMADFNQRFADESRSDVDAHRPLTAYAMRNAIITVCVDAKQNVTLLYKGKSLPCTVFHKQTKQAEVVLTKDLNIVIEAVPFKPAPDYPWRTFNLSKNNSKTPPRAVGTFLLWEKGDILTLR
jgi:hypothetical protein